MKLNFAKLLAALGILLLAAGGYALLRSRDGNGEQTGEIELHRTW